MQRRRDVSLNSGVALLAFGAADGVFHWSVIVPYIVAAILGSPAGERVADRISGASLTRSSPCSCWSSPPTSCCVR